jgi:hypothetical protein
MPCLNGVGSQTVYYPVLTISTRYRSEQQFKLSKMIIFETSMSAFELLWDISIAILILRLAFFYYALTYLTGFILGIVRVGIFVRSYHYGAPIAELIEMPFMLLGITFWAMFVVIKFDIPKVAWIRLAIGLLGLAFLLATELIGRIIVYGDAWPASMSKTEILAKGAFAALVIMFGLMPWLVMLPKGRRTGPREESLGQGRMQPGDKEYAFEERNLLICH